MRTLVWLSLGLLLAGAPASASAQEDGFPILISGGLKGGGGGNLLGSPSNAPVGASVPFDDGVGGWGASVGPYVQGTILDGLLSLELGLNFDWGENWSEYTFNGSDFEFGWEFSVIRVPILLEVGTPGEGTRLVFGTGPEIAIGNGASGTLDPVPAGATVFDATDEGGTLWTFNLGLESPFKMLRVSFDIRYSMNLDAAEDYGERVTGPNAFQLTGVQARHRHDLRLLLGFGYDYELQL